MVTYPFSPARAYAIGQRGYGHAAGGRVVSGLLVKGRPLTARLGDVYVSVWKVSELIITIRCGGTYHAGTCPRVGIAAPGATRMEETP